MHSLLFITLLKMKRSWWKNAGPIVVRVMALNMSMLVSYDQRVEFFKDNVGCVRPYVAELGLVVESPNNYHIGLGGTPNQTSLARMDPQMRQTAAWFAWSPSLSSFFTAHTCMHVFKIDSLKNPIFQ